MDEKIKKDIRKLRKTSKFAYAGSVNAEGFPQVKCMFNIKSDNIAEHYFWSNTGSKRASQYKENPKASVYYCDETFFKGALFTGVMEVCTDEETKARFWEKSCERYYTGVDDPDYCILKFTAEKVNYYHGLNNTTLSIEEAGENAV